MTRIESHTLIALLLRVLIWLLACHHRNYACYNLPTRGRAGIKLWDIDTSTSAKQVIRTGSGRPLEPVLATGAKGSVLEGEPLEPVAHKPVLKALQSATWWQ